jgi:hypothetical protein
MRCNPIKKKPFIHYSIIPIFQYDESATKCTNIAIKELLSKEAGDFLIPSIYPAYHLA